MVVHMFSQVVLVHKSFAACFANVRSFSSVNSHLVILEVTALIELYVANWAFELLLGVVNYHVFVQVASGAQDLVADMTFVLFRPCIRGLVLNNSIFVFVDIIVTFIFLNDNSIFGRAQELCLVKKLDGLEQFLHICQRLGQLQNRMRHVMKHEVIRVFKELQVFFSATDDTPPVFATFAINFRLFGFLLHFR